MVSLPFISSSDLPLIASFLFMFAIVYGVLAYARMFEHTRQVNIAIALVIAFFSASYRPFVSSLQAYMPYASILMAILFFYVLVKRIFAPQGERIDALPISLATGISIVIIGLLWDKIAPVIPGISSDNILWILGLSAVLIILYAGYRSQ